VRRKHNRYSAGASNHPMVQKSTWVILLGVVLLFVPIPPVASAVVGLAVIALGVALRFVGDE